MGLLAGRDFLRFPKFRHNLWTFSEGTDMARLIVSHSKFDVPVDEAREFLEIRSFCTGHNSLESVSSKSGVSLARVEAIIGSMSEARILHLPFESLNDLSIADVRSVILSACQLWSEQLRDHNISVEIVNGELPRRVVIGWLLETYHYIKAFPKALAYASEHAEGELKDVIIKYAEQEKGHEAFIAACLENLGLSIEEIEASIPLVSTRAIDLLMKEMFALEPCTVLMVARLVEAYEIEEDSIDHFKTLLENKYQIDGSAVDPLFAHARIDEEMGHAKLLEENLHLLEFRDINHVHDVINKLHDFKHAIDLQGLEIKDYYSKTGNYFPRQYVDYFAI